MHQLSQEITRISNNTTFNDSKLLDGSFEEKKIHIGANKGQNLSIEIGNMNAKSLGVVGASVAHSYIGGDITAANDTLKDISVTWILSTTPKAETKAQFDDQGNIIVTLGTNENGTLDATKNDAVEALKKIGIKAAAPNNDLIENWVVGSTQTIFKGTLDHRKGINISTQKNASDAITVIDNAINIVSSERGKMGAIQNRIEHTIGNLNTSAENLTS